MVLVAKGAGKRVPIELGLGASLSQDLIHSHQGGAYQGEDEDCQDQKTDEFDFKRDVREKHNYSTCLDSPHSTLYIS